MACRMNVLITYGFGWVNLLTRATNASASADVTLPFIGRKEKG